ncbi:MAG: DUF2339 domain-containing protein [Planctomycetes bacterium]|nr:DUF2339 domain-containing protein [Planctomycetota bacterium]
MGESLMCLLSVAFLAAVVIGWAAHLRQRARTAVVEAELLRLRQDVREIQLAAARVSSLGGPAASPPRGADAAAGGAADARTDAGADVAADVAEHVAAARAAPHAVQDVVPLGEWPRRADAPTPPPLPPDVPVPVAVPSDASHATASQAPRDDAQRGPGSGVTMSPLEALVGGRVLLVTGVVAMLICVAYFLKMAIDREWVSAGGRIAMGTIAGAFAVFAGYRMQSRGLSVFGQSVMGMGLGAIYLCDFFASVRYGMWSRPSAFAIVAVLTVAGATLAVRRNAPFLAWLGFLGAWFAPWLLGESRDALEGLTAWLAVVDLGVAATLIFRRWTGLDVLASVATMGYFLGWRGAYFSAERIGVSAGCLGVLVIVLMIVSLLPAALARRRLAPASMGAALLGLLAAYVTSYDLYFPEHRTQLALAALGGAGLVAALAVVHRKRVADGAPDGEAMFAGALALVVAAIPILFRGVGVAPAWSALGAAAIHGGVRLGRRWLVVGGFVAISLAGGDALLHQARIGDRVADPVFGAEFFAALSPCAALLVAAWSLRKARDAVANSIDASADLTLTASAWCVALLVLRETWRAFETTANGGSTQAALAASTFVIATFACSLALIFRSQARVAALPAWGPLALAGVLGLQVVVGPRAAAVPFWNPMFLAGGAVVGAWIVASRAGPGPRTVPGVGATVYAYLLIAGEIVAWGRHRVAAGDSRGAADFDVATTFTVFSSLYGCGIALAGARWRHVWWLRGASVACGLAMWAAGGARLFTDDRGAASYFGTSFLLALVAAAALVVVSWSWKRAAGPEEGRGLSWLGAMREPDVPWVAAVAYVFSLTSIEIHAWGGHGALGESLTRSDLRFRAQVALSVFWAGYAASLVGAGFLRRCAAVRWAGITLFLATVTKVFLVDLARLEAAYKVGSFMALGALLVGVSYLYQRVRREAPGQDTPK